MQHRLRVSQQPLMLRGRLLRPCEPDQLHLIELVNADQAARVLPVRPGFAAEARCVRRVPDRQLLGRQHVVPVDVRDRDLRRRDEIESVHRHVHVLLVIR